MFESKKIPVPRIGGEYIPIYRPKADIYAGADTKRFRHGERVENWVVNDFSVLREGGTWHMVGITHPKPADFGTAFRYEEDGVHEAEYQLFHCSAEGEHFADVLREDAFTDLPKLLYPAERPGERPELWAPHLMVKDGKHLIVYSPGKIRLAASEGWDGWETGRVLFEANTPMARDPYIFERDGVYGIVYTEQLALWLRESTDLEAWSEPKLLQKCPFPGADCESPFLFRRAGFWYLFWSIYDGRNGCYDERTMVYAAETLEGLASGAPLTMLPAHAPELVFDLNPATGEEETYMLSVFHPVNGISAVKLVWEE